MGECWIVDPTEDEEACAAACVSVGVSLSGRVGAVLKDGMASLKPATLLGMIETARRLGSRRVEELHKKLNEVGEELGMLQESF